MVAIDKQMLDYFYRTPIYMRAAPGAEPVLYKPALKRMEELQTDQERIPDGLFIASEDEDAGLFELRSKVSLELQQHLVSQDPARIKSALAGLLDIVAANPNRSGAEIATGAVELLVYEYSQYKIILDGLLKVALNNSHAAVHSVNVLALTLRYCHVNLVPANVTRRMAMSALLHDIGKAHIDAMLLAPSEPLDEAMFKQYQQHTAYGFRMLKDCGIPDDVCDSALRHHERVDGSGYPDGIRDVSEFSQVIGLIHDFESLVYFGLPYRPPEKPASVLARLKDETLRGRFDRALFQRFVRSLVTAG